MSRPEQACTGKKCAKVKPHKAFWTDVDRLGQFYNVPVQQATKVELFINLKTAKALGITIPLPLSGRADEIFE
jgi:hypothetical protein